MNCVCREIYSGQACASELGSWQGWQVVVHHDALVVHTHEQYQLRGHHACVRAETASCICCLCTTI